MKSPSLRFLLPFVIAGAVAGCGNSAGQSSLPASTQAAAQLPGQTTDANGQRLTTQAITATPVPSGTYWSGTVSAINTNGITANCGQSNFAAGYGCLPVVTTGATVTGTPVTGQYFQLWADLSKLPNITATTINYSATKFPITAPTAAPGNTATATPTAAATAAATIAAGTSGLFNGFANAADYPVSFTPYAATSVFNTRVSANPTIASYSAAVIAAQFPGGVNNGVVRANEAGQYDYNHPRFFASTADPLVRVACTAYCGDPDNGGVPAQIHIPAGARPAGGGDAHLDIVQPDGTEISMFGTSRPAGDYASGGTVTAANVANCGSFASASGWLTIGPGPTAAGYCDDAGIVTAAELNAGAINHALFIVGECAVGNQYPSQPGAVTDRCTSGVGPPLGGREWYDVPCATTQASASLRPWEKAILCALNQYGAYLGDDLDGAAHFTGGLTPELESEEPWYDFNGSNYTSPFAVLASQGWAKISIANAHPGVSGTRWIGADPWRPAGVDFASHIHWLDPCSARGSC